MPALKGALQVVSGAGVVPGTVVVPEVEVPDPEPDDVWVAVVEVPPVEVTIRVARGLRARAARACHV